MVAGGGLKDGVTINMESFKKPLSLAEVAGASLLVLLLFVYLANRDGINTCKPHVLKTCMQTGGCMH